MSTKKKSSPVNAEQKKWTLVKISELTKRRLLIAAPHLETSMQELLDQIAADYLDQLEEFFPTYPERVRKSGAAQVRARVDKASLPRRRA